MGELPFLEIPAEFKIPEAKEDKSSSEEEDSRALSGSKLESSSSELELDFFGSDGESSESDHDASSLASFERSDFGAFGDFLEGEVGLARAWRPCDLTEDLAADEMGEDLGFGAGVGGNQWTSGEGPDEKT